MKDQYSKDNILQQGGSKPAGQTGQTGSTSGQVGQKGSDKFSTQRPSQGGASQTSTGKDKYQK